MKPTIVGDNLLCDGRDSLVISIVLGEKGEPVNIIGIKPDVIIIHCVC